MKSENWKEWRANLDWKTCLMCRTLHGRIFPIYEDLLEPPLHENCRCSIKILQAMLAGYATGDLQQGADYWLAHFGKLPDYYISLPAAELLGWVKILGNLADVAPGMMLSGGIYKNRDGKLPSAPERIWYEADINYRKGY